MRAHCNPTRMPLITPLVVSQQLVRLDVPLVIGVSVLLLVMAFNGRISGFGGLLLSAGIAAYTVFALRQSRKESAALQAERAQEFGDGATAGRGQRLPLQLALIVAGLALLVLSADCLVGTAVAIARLFGVSELVIGRTIIAAVVTPGGLKVAPARIRFDMPVMIAVALACLPIFATGHLLASREGRCCSAM